jgi:hypothetical protein
MIHPRFVEIGVDPPDHQSELNPGGIKDVDPDKPFRRGQNRAGATR